MRGNSTARAETDETGNCASGGRDRGTVDGEVCSACGASVDTDDWHPVATANVGGTLSIHAFCDEKCRQSWFEQ